jgi:hypothetical protein
MTEYNLNKKDAEALETMLAKAHEGLEWQKGVNQHYAKNKYTYEDCLIEDLVHEDVSCLGEVSYRLKSMMKLFLEENAVPEDKQAELIAGGNPDGHLPCDRQLVAFLAIRQAQYDVQEVIKDQSYRLPCY